MAVYSTPAFSMRHSALRQLAGAALLILTFVVPVMAELPPQYYREMQEKAAERLKIRVTGVSRDWYFWRNERKVSVSAEVVNVVRSASGIGKGDIVSFEYTIFSPPSHGWVGPRPMPLLAAGAEYDFFGERQGVAKDKGIVLTPTARGYSFESLIETP